MTTRRGLRDKIENALHALAATHGHYTLGEGGDKIIIGYLDEIAATLEECKGLTTGTAKLGGVPKLEVALEDWSEIERLSRAVSSDREDGKFDVRRRARRVIRALESWENEIAQLRARLAQHGLETEPKA